MFGLLFAEVLPEVGIGLMLLVAAVIGLVWFYFYQQQWMEKKRQVLENGQAVLGWIVQANTELFRPDPLPHPAQVLVTFDTSIPDVAACLADLARRISSLKGKSPSDPVERRVAKLVTDEDYVQGSRVKLPPEFTGGLTVYSCHVMIWRHHLVGEVLSKPFIRCKTMPGDEGEVFMVPYEADD